MQGPADFGVVIVAAGRGERAGSAAAGPKQYRLLGGKAVIARTVEAFRRWRPACPIVVVRHADDEALLAASLGEAGHGVMSVPGGATRQASVRLGLAALAAADCPPAWVMIHDAARPFVTAGLLERIAETIAAAPDVGVIPALPIAETVKAAEPDGTITRTVPRDGLYRAQTPQTFPLADILAIHDKAAARHDVEFTDDASLYEWASSPVRLIAGEKDNIKLTFPEDFVEAERMLADSAVTVPDIRVGHGYDTHQFVPGDEVILCGVTIPHNRRLSGHSDADVGFHALTDALLATIGAGDIGSHFPPSDPRWKGAPSHIFLDHAARLVREEGGTITHCDVTLLCEAPKIGPHRDAMRAEIARVVGIDIGRASVKATTNERIGFIGREEGMVGLATATVVFAPAGKDTP